MIKENLFVRAESGYYPSDACLSAADLAYRAACAESDAAGREQVDAWYAEQTAPLRTELSIAQYGAAEAASTFVPTGALEVGATAVKVA